MSDENIQKPAPDYGDLIKNLKAETDRKLGNLESNITNSLAQLSGMLAERMPTARIEETSAPDPYNDPQGFLNQVQQKVSDVVSKTVDAKLNNYENAAVSRSQLYTEFPELGDQSHPVTQDVISRFQALSPEQKRDADAHLKSIVYQVAAEKGLRPKSFRSADDDNFSLGAERGERNMAPKKDPEKYDGIKKGTAAWAEIMKEVGANIDISSDADLKKLQEYSQRKNWTSLEQSPEFKRGKK